jgi:hypothetical protein
MQNILSPIYLYDFSIVESRTTRKLEQRKAQIQKKLRKTKSYYNRKEKKNLR